MLGRFGTRREIGRTVLAVAPECGAVVCLVALIWLGIWLALANQRTNLIEGAQRDSANLARALEENSARFLAGADQLLLALRSAYERRGAAFDLSGWVARENSPYWLTSRLSIIGKDGSPLAATMPGHETYFADRPYFAAQRDSTGDQMQISEPMLGRVSGRWSVALTRKIQSFAGDFAGVAVLSVDCYQLSGVYQSMDLQGGFVALAGLDGVIRARGPIIPGAIAAPLDLGEATAKVLTTGSGTIRIPGQNPLTVSYRRLDGYPLVVMVAFGEDEVLSNFRTARRWMVAAGAAASLVVLMLGYVWVRQRKRSIASQQELALSLENMSQGLAMVDADERLRVINRRAVELLGLSPDIMASLRTGSSKQRTAAERALRKTLHDRFLSADRRPGEPFSVGNLMVEGSTTLIPDGGTVHVITDVTERYTTESRIRYMALHDHLTGLGNRALLAEETDRLIEAGATFAVLLLDLNGFKSVNDTFGHDVGDELLIAVARQLTRAVPATDLVARYGGDEFAILSRSPNQPDASQLLAESIADAFEGPVRVSGQELRIGASVGIASYPVNGSSRAELLRNADLAMYAAKENRAGPFRVFEPAMADAVQDRLRMEEELRAAIGTDQLYLEYQPQFRASTLDIVGFEALVRWDNPVRGRVRPDIFIPLAEETGLIVPLGRIILEQACRCALEWPENIRIAVNLSPVQFRDPRLPATVAELLATTGLAPKRLELEVTEGVLIADERQALSTLSALGEVGVGLTLDDFGTGYASLSYLSKFPFERIKLDRSFVQAQVHELRARHILESVLALSRRLGLGVVAEGVETRAQLHLLRQQNCQDIQGFLTGKPMPKAETMQIVAPRPKPAVPQLGSASFAFAAGEL